MLMLRRHRVAHIFILFINFIFNFRIIGISSWENHTNSILECSLQLQIGIHIPDLVSSLLQDPSGRSGGGKDLPKELLPPLSLQTWHVEPKDDAQTHVTLSHTCPCTMTSRRGYSHCNQSTLQLDRDSPLLNGNAC